MKAVFEETLLAESSNTEVVENNHYFPREDVNMDYLIKSETQYTCPWKGDATYYHIITGEDNKTDGAWSYEAPKEAAKNIAGHICFEKELVSE
ncbi:DUF427 domain-containing protein [Alkalibacterium olivapovliticus]|uniref:Uncharacterized protein (DUF427 family) n=1 Tax=Alkalibacterium olivapovliticus TaxID=99907 RepID=A0A2T0WC45_9LACT|nr:DUF427 domain-containing protein [Alkalibacterium olivapovliticus]PRY84257.1 uncharacterized protein (DUF427 family) [Alkalibacterium olivapovliticus]